MKHLKLIMAVLAACFCAPVGFRTANAKAAAPAEPSSDTPPETPPPFAVADNSTLGLLAKGAGVDPEDVRWRVAAGLDVKQAVDAALAQKESDAKKGGK